MRNTLDFTKIVPVNPVLAFLPLEPGPDNNLVTAIGVGAERATYLSEKLFSTAIELSSEGGAGAHEMVALASQIAETPQELAYLVYGLAYTDKDKSDFRPEDANYIGGSRDE